MAASTAMFLFLLAAVLPVSSYADGDHHQLISQEAVSSTKSAPPVKPSPPPYKKPPTPTPSPLPSPTPSVPKPPTASPAPAPAPAAPSPFVRSIKDCAPMCLVRCQRHSRPNLCNRACMTCCSRCKCVPPGTHGNREKCGTCYTGMTTRLNKPKCP